MLGLSLLAGMDNGIDMPLHKQMRTFVSLYGLNPLLMFMVWEIIKRSDKGKPKHLLWSLFFPRQYDNTVFLCYVFGVLAQTWRKWVWLFIDAIAALKVVSFCCWLLSCGSCCCTHHAELVIFLLVLLWSFVPIDFLGQEVCGLPLWCKVSQFCQWDRLSYYGADPI